MRERGLGDYAKGMLLAALIVFGGAGTAAAVSSSPSYQVVETEFGSGTMQSCSGQYCAHASIGALGGGSGASGSHSAAFGPISSSDPLLEVIVEEGESNLGELTTEKTATKTMTVQVRNYLSGGYTLQIIGDPPKYGNHHLSTPSSPTESKPGTEQFAINAAVNTTPKVGADPVQKPSSQTSFGVVNDDYRTPNFFKYESGSVVAHSGSQSGRTDYTISMIVNVSSATPAGHYSGDFSAVVIPVY